jgi:uncharacterized protein YndB with AHSA1/START domain/ketosteroid isomerase-like protein
MNLVDRTVDIDADPTTVYEHFVDANRFMQWMAPHAEIEPHPGGRIRWTHHNGDSCEGRFVELVPGRRIVFTYGWDRPDVEVPPGTTTVEITLAPIASGTRLRLKHSGLSGPMANAHDGGWANYLHRLSVAAGGRDPGPDPLANERVPRAADLAVTIVSPEAIVRSFNDAINHQDLYVLSALMSEDHRFVDSADSVVEGKEACVEAWRSFFTTFPDYRNHFESVLVDGNDVLIDGHSTCSVAALAGPARWHARARNGLVEEWRVEDPRHLHEP